MLTYIHTYIHAYIHTYIHTYTHYVTVNYTALHYIPLHCITLHYIPLHRITLHCVAYITLHYIHTLHYTPFHYTRDMYTYTYHTFHCITLHTLHYITSLHCITFHCTAYIPVPKDMYTHTYITLHYITLHCITFHSNTLQYITYTHTYTPKAMRCTYFHARHRAFKCSKSFTNIPTPQHQTGEFFSSHSFCMRTSTSSRRGGITSAGMGPHMRASCQSPRSCW